MTRDIDQVVRLGGWEDLLDFVAHALAAAEADEEAEAARVTGDQRAEMIARGAIREHLRDVSKIYKAILRKPRKTEIDALERIDAYHEEESGE